MKHFEVHMGSSTFEHSSRRDNYSTFAYRIRSISVIINDKSPTYCTLEGFWTLQILRMTYQDVIDIPSKSIKVYWIFSWNLTLFKDTHNLLTSSNSKCRNQNGSTAFKSFQHSVNKFLFCSIPWRIDSLSICAFSHNNIVLWKILPCTRSKVRLYGVEIAGKEYSFPINTYRNHSTTWNMSSIEQGHFERSTKGDSLLIGCCLTLPSNKCNILQIIGKPSM